MSAARNIIANLSTMTDDAMVYKVSSCFFFGVSFLFLIVAQNLSENKEIYQVVCWISDHVCCFQHNS